MKVNFWLWQSNAKTGMLKAAARKKAPEQGRWRGFCERSKDKPVDVEIFGADLD